MKSRPGIFISLILVVSAVAGLLGFAVIRHSQTVAPMVSEEDRQYMATHKSQAKDTDKQQASQYSTNISQQEKLPISETESGSSVKVFFSKADSLENDPSNVIPIDRSISSNTKKPIDVAISELINGPNQSELAKGLSGGIKLSGNSSCNGKDYSLIISDQKIQLQFCKERQSNGTSADIREQAQIVSTLKQFSDSENIVILDQAGNCVFDTSGLNFCKK